MDHGGRAAPVKSPRARQACPTSGSRVRGNSPSYSSQVRVKRCLFQGTSARWLPFASAHLGGLVCEFRHLAASWRQVMSIDSDLSNSLAWVGGASNAAQISALLYSELNAQRQNFTSEPLSVDEPSCACPRKPPGMN